MRARRAGLTLVLLGALAMHPGLASAQDPLDQAEQAYLDVDFARTRELAQQALSRGGYGRADLVRIYRLLGVAAAALGDEAASRDAYVRMLALDPAAELPGNLSPRLLQPLMEARGQWTARQGQFALEARRLRGARGIELSLEDPLGMAARVIVFARARGRETQRIELTAEPTSVVRVPDLTAEDDIEYYAHVVDSNGNRLIELGTEVEPIVLESQVRGSNGGTDERDRPSPPPGGGGLTPWLAITAGALTLVSGGILTWSIVDILDQHADYLTAPTLDKYYHGLDLQTRTNVLVATTAVLGVATAVLMIFTDWGGRSESTQTHVMPIATPDSIGVAVLGAMP